LDWFLYQIAGACALAETTVAATLAKAKYWLHFAEAPLNLRQRKALNRVLDAGPAGFEGGLTTRKYASLADVGRVTAYKELTDLVRLGCLVPLGKGGRSSAYDIPWEQFSAAKR
jgi:Fic family protein